jgi:hypothetical protein
MPPDMASSYTREFCSFLEYRLGDAFALSRNEAVRGFWCDGVGTPYFDYQLTRKRVNDTRKIETKAWIGPSGQEEYALVIHFGKYALRRYAKGGSLNDCVPTPDMGDDWFTIDTTSQTLEIYLR